ncbi:MAG TPA: type VI secretion system tip protein TssI/VgrG, partial [Gemmatimonadaceae bacterium]
MASLYTQAGKPMRVSSPLPADTLLLEWLSGIERVSEPFELTLDLLSTEVRIDPDEVLRKPLVVTVDLAEGGRRIFHGLARRFVQRGRSAGLVSYRAEIVPALWFLSLATDCRIFQHKTVPDIVKQVLSDSGITDVKLSLSATYAPREYCVQYRETHLAFVSRLLEEEGIFYFFEHTADKHTLVLADAPAAVHAGSVSKLPVTVVEGGNLGSGDYITELQVESLVCSGKVTLVDYNDLMPQRLESTVAGVAPKPSAANLRIFDYPGKFAAVSDGDRLARLRMEEREMLAHVVTGRTNCRALASGHKVEITDHYRRDVNQAYHLLSLSHSGRVGGYRSGEAADDAFHFDTTFVAIPHGVPYRPLQRTPKSIVQGTQTATVVGPAGEEIFVDKFGRVKVQFFWDQTGQRDDKSSCWVRVSNAW